jgi:hypothetical protein
MIIAVAVNFKEIIKQGKKYDWPRPPGCQRCGNGLWGHGYVRRYFEEASEGCWIKRYHCPRCRLMITMRPQNYWSRFYKQSKSIRRVLACREKEKQWPPGISRQSAGHWKRGLKSQVEKLLGLMTGIFPTGFEELIKLGWIPVSRSKTSVAIAQPC